MKKTLTATKIDISRITPVTPINAVYTASKRKGYAGNPLIEAIQPPPTGDEEAAERMTVKPEFDRNLIKNLSTRERLDRIDDLDDLHVPTSWHLMKEQRLTSVLLKGLRARNPLTPEGAMQLVTAGHKMPFWNDPAQKPEGSIVLIDGMSGMGKTCFVKGAARCWGGPVIRHTQYQGKYFSEIQILYLKVNCPEDRSLKGLAVNLLFSIIQLIGPDKGLINTLLNPHVTRKVLVSTLRYLIATYHIGILVIDEIRNLFLRSKKTGQDNFKPEDSEIVAFLMNLRDEVKIPIVLIGTPEASEHLDTSLSMNRRLAKDGDFSMLPPQNAEDPDWQLLCEKAWEYQWVLKPAELAPEIVEKLFFLTTGITGLLIALLQAAQRLAIHLEIERVDIELLTQAYFDEFKKLHPILDAIREGDPLAKVRWSDIWLPKAS